MRTIILDAALVGIIAVPSSVAQESYWSSWFDRLDRTPAEQPHWITPLATTTPRVQEEFRCDQLWRVNSAGVTTE